MKMIGCFDDVFAIVKINKANKILQHLNGKNS